MYSGHPHGMHVASCNSLADRIIERHDSIIEILVEHEVYAAAHYEMGRAIATLRGMGGEFARVLPAEGTLHASVFLPLNQPLYATVMFAIAPSAFCERVYMRPPVGMENLFARMYETIGIDEFFPNVTLHPVSRKLFREMYVCDSEAVIFTGKYENAVALASEYRDTTLIYSGTGVNPFVVCSNADLDFAAAKAVEMRTFNSGQDCSAPDAFLVPASIADAFQEQLIARLDTLRLGANNDPTSDIGPIMRTSYCQSAADWLDAHRANIVYGGDIDFEQSRVYPAIVRSHVKEIGEDFHEFFSPIFNVLVYDDDAQLAAALSKPQFTQKAMYASVFGSASPAVLEILSATCSVLIDQIANDVDNGNTSFGGWGPQANFIAHGGQREIRPILISDILGDAYEERMAA